MSTRDISQDRRDLLRGGSSLCKMVNSAEIPLGTGGRSSCVCDEIYSRKEGRQKKEEIQ